MSYFVAASVSTSAWQCGLKDMKHGTETAVINQRHASGARFCQRGSTYSYASAGIATTAEMSVHPSVCPSHKKELLGNLQSYTYCRRQNVAQGF